MVGKVPSTPLRVLLGDLSAPLSRPPTQSRTQNPPTLLHLNLALFNSRNVGGTGHSIFSLDPQAHWAAICNPTSTSIFQPQPSQLWNSNSPILNPAEPKSQPLDHEAARILWEVSLEDRSFCFLTLGRLQTWGWVSLALHQNGYRFKGACVRHLAWEGAQNLVEEPTAISIPKPPLPAPHSTCSSPLPHPKNINAGQASVGTEAQH